MLASLKGYLSELYTVQFESCGSKSTAVTASGRRRRIVLQNQGLLGIAFFESTAFIILLVLFLLFRRDQHAGYFRFWLAGWCCLTLSSSLEVAFLIRPLPGLHLFVLSVQAAALLLFGAQYRVYNTADFISLSSGIQIGSVTIDSVQILVLVLGYVFLYGPIISLIVYSFNGACVCGFPPRDLTLNWYRLLFADQAIWTSVLNSLLVAIAAMAISLTFGIPAALALDRANFPGKALFRRLVLLPLILPGIITGLSLLMLFREADVKLSLLTIVLGHGTALISVATTEVFAGLQKLDRAQEEASLDLGANYWQTFWRVTLPNLRLSIIGAALLIFTLSMDEIAVSFFLIGRDNTLPLEIWGRLRRGITPEINAISTIIFVFSLAAIVTWYRLRAGAEVKTDAAL